MINESPFLGKMAVATLIGTTLCSSLSAAERSAQQPNVVFILIDDLGYADVEPYGSTKNKTPNISQMAEEGICFTSFYAAALSSPARSALMTGCYPKRVGLSTGSWHPVLMPGDHLGLNPEEFILPEVFKEQGYVTGCFGKWHLGDQKEFLPCQQGFDEFYGTPGSNDTWALTKSSPTWKGFVPESISILRGNKVIDSIDDMEEQAQLCKMMTDEAVKFIKKNHDKPFFAYIPHQFIHVPRNARQEFYNREVPYDNIQMATNSGYYAQARLTASVQEVDWSVGVIFDTLRELGIDDNTLVVFMSDNGGVNNAPLRGVKGSAWEGGSRVPAIFWWPEKIPAGVRNDEILSIMDVMPTMASIVGTELPTDRVIDGHDITPLLFGESEAASPWEVLYIHRLGVLAAARCGDWKYMADGSLYNLKEDIGEKKNVAQENPEIVAKMQKYMTAMRDELDCPYNCRRAGYVERVKPLGK